MLATASGVFAALYAYFQEDADMGINSVGDRKRVERALYHNGDDRPGQTEERKAYELIALVAKVVALKRGYVRANVMSRFGSARDEVRVTAAGPPRDVRNAVAHRPEQKRASGSAPSGPWQALLTHSQCKGPAVRAARLEGNGPGDDRDVQNILMPLLLSKGMPPKRLGLIRNCLRVGCSSRVRGQQLT